MPRSGGVIWTARRYYPRGKTGSSLYGGPNDARPQPQTHGIERNAMKPLPPDTPEQALITQYKGSLLIVRAYAGTGGKQRLSSNMLTIT